MTKFELQFLRDPFNRVNFCRFRKNVSLLLNDEWSEILTLTEGDFKAIMLQLVKLEIDRFKALELENKRIVLSIIKAEPSEKIPDQIKACEQILKHIISDAHAEHDYENAFVPRKNQHKI